ncbi:hypothetical protein BH24ACT20_BH24ACT20_00110 [soil metagenome]
MRPGRENHREMTRILEDLKGVLPESATDELAERVESELAARGYGGGDEVDRCEPERCARCGGLRREADHGRNTDRVCRCGGRKKRLLSYLDAVDSGRHMTLDALEASEATMTAALTAARGIVSDDRERGMLLMGLSGTGKTHLMVGVGRALLERNRDAGYYNVVRLISRIQDSYSDYGGETRRAIIDSVASHEVVLLDDLGKEHTSTNVESIVYELVDALHTAGVTLVISTNVPAVRGGGYSGPTLSDRYDAAVRSRLRDMCERFVVRGDDRRWAAWEW